MHARMPGCKERPVRKPLLWGSTLQPVLRYRRNLLHKTFLSPFSNSCSRVQWTLTKIEVRSPDPARSSRRLSQKRRTLDRLPGRPEPPRIRTRWRTGEGPRRVRPEKRALRLLPSLSYLLILNLLAAVSETQPHAACRQTSARPTARSPKKPPGNRRALLPAGLLTDRPRLARTPRMGILFRTIIRSVPRS